jgi:hypothetical protein
MLVRIQAVAAAAAFTGTAGAGLIDWTAATNSLLPLPPNLDVCPTIYSIAVETTSPVPNLDCRLMRPGVVLASLDRITISRPSTPAAGFSKAGCHLQVPREDSGAPWLVVLTSDALAADATFVIYFGLGGAPQGVA